ncbi:hypothetical protein BC937DRAFT_86380 [Endogone sp. FLAS-F59071]|nr:hypothetical protein BC937DRAFT_86380 [Endogone sp. FLAS-F59071]|eukprot:RUS20089.1 hypothetical protein BC937DRAFT_86380 [Endogone sp. FLAS-F59071]
MSYMVHLHLSPHRGALDLIRPMCNESLREPLPDLTREGLVRGPWRYGVKSISIGEIRKECGYFLEESLRIRFSEDTTEALCGKPTQ